jgi:Tol biopolymer transport system component
VKTVRINHLRAALLAAAAAGLLAAVGLFVVVLYAQPAEANFPGKPGKIAFSGKDAPNGDYEIYTIKPDGGGRQPVTDNSSDDSSPSFSPSGKRIAYVNSTGTDSEIWTIQPNGGGRQQVTDNANNDRDPYWGSQ